jgi:solute carrier family 35 protein
MAVYLLASGSRSLSSIVQSCRHLWPLAFVSMINTFVAISSLEGLNLPMYNACKRLTSLVTLGMEALVLKRYSSLPIQGTVLLIALGALLAAAHDIEFDLLSYAMALLSCCMNALYLTLIKRECNRKRQASRVDAAAGDERGNTVAEIALVNSLVPIPWLLFYLEASQERARVFAFDGWANPNFWAAIVASTVAGCLLGYSQGICTQHSSALTTTIVGQMKMVLSTYLGIVLFETKLSSLQFLGESQNARQGL